MTRILPVLGIAVLVSSACSEPSFFRRMDASARGLADEAGFKGCQMTFPLTAENVTDLVRWNGGFREGQEGPYRESIAAKLNAGSEFRQVDCGATFFLVELKDRKVVSTIYEVIS